MDETTPPRPAALVLWRQAVEERVLDQQATGKRAQKLPGWRPSRPDVNR